MKVYVFLLLCCGLHACKAPDDDVPRDLVVTKTESGKTVSLSCTATNAKYFEFIFEQGVDLITNQSGKASYTYKNTGDYRIKVTAYSDSRKNISEEISISITEEVNDSPNPLEPHANYEGMELVWSDEFNGSSLNSANWTHEIGTGSNGWGNNELQYYRAQNTSVSDGVLTIEAREESFSGSSYTSSRIVTQGKKKFRYGRIDIKAKLPTGQGLWPALWMLGSNFSSVGWPKCGEIDIMELVGHEPDRVFGTLHWLNGSQNAAAGNAGNPFVLPGSTFADDWHVFSISWDESTIVWYVDNKEHYKIAINSDLNAFNHEFFFIFNVAVGGNLPGSPSSTTKFPQKMMVDYVQVFQKK